MANELKLTVSLSFSKGGAAISKSKSLSLDVAGDVFTSGVQSIGTTEEEITIGADLTTPGYVFIINLDATNFVQIGSTTGVYDIKLKPGEGALYRHNSAAIYAKADTGACLVEYIVIED